VESHYGEWLEKWERPEVTVTTRVECSEYFPIRDQALLAHATQIDPDGAWFRVPRDLQVSVWPTEDFEAAVSYVPVTPVEDDLFAGIPDAATGDELATRGGLELVYDGRKEVTA
jgi:mycothiol S-conjugate amidase